MICRIVQLRRCAGKPTLLDAAAIFAVVATDGSKVTVAVLAAKSILTVLTPATRLIAVFTVIGHVGHVIFPIVNILVNRAAGVVIAAFAGAVAEVHAMRDAQRKFVDDFAAAWTTVMNNDRF